MLVLNVAPCQSHLPAVKPAAGTAEQRGGCQKRSFKSIPNVAALVLQVGSGALLGTAGFSAAPVLGHVQDESAQARSGACSPQAGMHVRLQGPMKATPVNAGPLLLLPCLVPACLRNCAE